MNAYEIAGRLLFGFLSLIFWAGVSIAFYYLFKLLTDKYPWVAFVLMSLFAVAFLFILVVFAMKLGGIV